MKFFSNLIFIALGIIIAALISQNTTITNQNLLTIGGILFTLSIIASYLTHGTKTVNSKPTPVKTKIKTAVKNPKPTNANTVSGQVKWFNKTKGFGFITQDNGDDIFVHQTALAFKSASLKDGQRVTMQIVMDSKGPQAENVRLA